MRIYVSSTMTDLQEHRQAVIRAIQRAGHQAVFMEIYGAERSAPIERCLADVASCDAYLVIIAFHYGSTPPDSAQSFVEQEYRCALQHGLEIKAYLLHEDAPWPTRLGDRDTSRERVERLRAEIGEKHVARFFSSADDLRACVTEDLASLPAASDSTPMPRPIIGICPADVSQIFKDRVTEIATLRQAVQSSEDRLVCIVGRGGLGKTALLSKLCMEIEDGETRVSNSATQIGADGMIYVSCKDGDGTSLERIFFAIGRVLNKQKETESLWADISQSIPARIGELLRWLDGGQCYLLVLDNAEDLLADDGHIADADLRSFIEICVTTRHKLRIVATSRRPIIVHSPGNQRICTVKLDLGLPDTEAIRHLRDLDSDGVYGLRDAPEALLLRAAKQCMGIPRALELLQGLLARDENDHLTLEDLLDDPTLFEKFEHIDLITNRKERLVENLVAASYHRGNEPQRRIVEILAAFGTAAPREAIDYVATELSFNFDVWSVLDSLVRARAVTFRRSQRCYELHPIDQAYSYARIPTEGDIDRRQWHRTIAAYYRTQEKTEQEWHTIDDIQPQLQEIRHLLAAEEWHEAATVLNFIDFPCLRIWGYASLRLELRKQLDGKLTEHQMMLNNTNLLGLAYFANAMNHAALRCYEKVIEETSADSSQYVMERRAASLFNKGVIHRDAGRFEESIASIYQGISVYETIGKSDPLSYATIGRCLLRIGQIDEGINAIRNAISINEKHGIEDRIYFERMGLYSSALGEASLFQRDYSTAITHTVKGLQWLERVSDRRGISTNLVLTGTAYLAQWNIVDARQALERAVALEVPKQRPLCYAMLGIIELADRNAEAAGDFFTRAVDASDALLALTPDLYEQHYTRALALLALRQEEMAIDAYRQAISITNARGVFLEALLRLSFLERAAPQTPGIAEVRELLEAQHTIQEVVV